MFSYFSEYSTTINDIDYMTCARGQVFYICIYLSMRKISSYRDSLHFLFHLIDEKKELCQIHIEIVLSSIILIETKAVRTPIVSKVLLALYPFEDDLLV